VLLKQRNLTDMLLPASQSRMTPDLDSETQLTERRLKMNHCLHCSLTSTNWTIFGFLPKWSNVLKCMQWGNSLPELRKLSFQTAAVCAQLDWTGSMIAPVCIQVQVMLLLQVQHVLLSTLQTCLELSSPVLLCPALQWVTSMNQHQARLPGHYTLLCNASSFFVFLEPWQQSYIFMCRTIHPSKALDSVKYAGQTC